MNDKLTTIPTEFLMQLFSGTLAQPTPSGLLSGMFYKYKLETVHGIEKLRAEIAEFKQRSTNAIVGGMVSWATSADKLSLEKNMIETQKQLNDIAVEIKKEERDKVKLENQILYYQSKNEEIDYKMREREFDEKYGTPKAQDRPE